VFTDEYTITSTCISKDVYNMCYVRFWYINSSVRTSGYISDLGHSNA